MTKRIWQACAVAALVLGVASPAGAFTALDEQCSLKIGVEAKDLQRFKTFREALAAISELEGDTEEVKVSEAEARKVLCPQSGCKPWKPFDFRGGIWINLLIPDDVGGVYVVMELGWIGGSSACSLGEPTKVEQVGAGVYLITMDEKAGSWGGGDDPETYCSDQEFATSRLLLDLHTGRWLVMALADDDSEISVEAGIVKAKACKTLKLEEGITKLRARKPRTLVVSPALPLINDGRRLTKAKKFDKAIARFDLAVKRDPAAARAWSGRGFAHMLAGHYDAARKDFHKALELNPDKAFQAAVWFNLGTIAEELKDKTAAREAYLKSRKLRPNKTVDKRLKKLGK